MAYLAFLYRSLTSFTSVRNYLSILSHINEINYSCAFWGDYDSQLATRAFRRLLGDVTARKHAMTVDILLQILPHLDSGNIFHTCMAALFLAAFFSFLRISNLVPRTLRDISNPHPFFLKRSDVRFSPRGAVLSVARTKTLQFNQRLLDIPLPIIPGSRLPFQLCAFIYTASLRSIICHFSVCTSTISIGLFQHIIIPLLSRKRFQS